MFENLREIFERLQRGDIDRSTWHANGALFTYLPNHPGGEWAWHHYAGNYEAFRHAVADLPKLPPAA